MTWKLLAWPALSVLLAWMQGWLMPAVRRTVPGPEAQRQDIALHWVGTVAYFLPWVLWPTRESAAAALWSRALFFDPVLNLTSGKDLFYVGYTAASDRFFRSVAAALNAGPDRIRAFAWVVTAAAGVILLILL